MTKMKTFKRFSAAKAAALGNPILRIGDLFIVGISTVDKYGVSIDLIDAKGAITGSITAKHLDRIGNGNHATAVTPYASRIWPD